MDAGSLDLFNMTQIIFKIVIFPSKINLLKNLISGVIFIYYFITLKRLPLEITSKLPFRGISVWEIFT